MRYKLYCAVLRVMVGLLFAVPVFSQGQINSVAQDAYNYFNAKYGYDPTFVNGKYFVDLSLHDLGHPYYNEKKYQEANIQLNKSNYQNHKLMYNVFDQTLVIQYSDSKDNPFAFIPPTGFVSEFSILSDTFYYYSYSEDMNGYYKKVYTSEDVECLIQYNKSRTISHHNETFSAFKYSELKHTYYLSRNDKLSKFTSKKDLLQFYTDSEYKAIKGYLKSHKVKIRNASVAAISDLISFCENL